MAAGGTKDVRRQMSGALYTTPVYRYQIPYTVTGTIQLQHPAAAAGRKHEEPERNPHTHTHTHTHRRELATVYSSSPLKPALLHFFGKTYMRVRPRGEANF